MNNKKKKAEKIQFSKRDIYKAIKTTPRIFNNAMKRALRKTVQPNNEY